MECDPNVREHLRHACRALHGAAGSVRDQLHVAARHALQAGLAALDAREAKRRTATPPPPPAT